MFSLSVNRELVTVHNLSSARSAIKTTLNESDHDAHSTRTHRLMVPRTRREHAQHGNEHTRFLTARLGETVLKRKKLVVAHAESEVQRSSQGRLENLFHLERDPGSDYTHAHRAWKRRYVDIRRGISERALVLHVHVLVIDAQVIAHIDPVPCHQGRVTRGRDAHTHIRRQLCLHE